MLQHINLSSQGAPSRPFELRFLRLPELLPRRGRSRSSHWRDVKSGLFPPPVALGARCSGWPVHELEVILGAQIAGASPDEIRTLVARLVAARAQLMPSEAA